MTRQLFTRFFHAFLLSGCIVALSMGLPSFQGGGKARAQEHEVDSNVGQVEHTDTLDAVSQTNAETISGLLMKFDNGSVELSSPVFTPGDKLFDEFKEQGTHVDIELNPAGPMPSRDKDTSKKIKFSSLIVVDNAGAFPLQGEGNLKGGGGDDGEVTSSNKRFWAAKMDIPDLTLHIVPARDLNGTTEGRGEVPNIPKNAVLPVMLSGTDEANEVKVAVRAVFSEPLTSDLEIEVTVESGDTNKATITDPQVTFTVPAGRTEYYSNGEEGSVGGPYNDANRTAIVVGGVLSENDTDTTEIVATVGQTTQADTTSQPADLLRYEFELALATAENGEPENGIPQRKFDDDIKQYFNEFNFDGDHMIGELSDDKFADTEDVRGFEFTDQQKASVEYNYAVMGGGTQLGQIDLAVEAVDGGTAIAQDPGNGIGPFIIYSKTSLDQRSLKKALWGDTSWSWGSGDQTSGLEITKVNGAIPPIRENDPGKDRFPEDTTFVIRNNATYNLLASDRGALTAKTITTELSNDPAVAIVKTNPAAAFSGEVSCNVQIQRSGIFWVEAYSNNNTTDALLVALQAVVLNYAPDGTDIVFDSLKHSFAHGAAGEAKVAAAAHMAYGIRSGTKLVESTGNLASLQENRAVKANDSNEPLKKEAIADSGIILPGDDQDDGDITQSARNDQAVVFDIAESGSETRIPIWSAASVQAKKTASEMVAWGYMTWGEVELITPSDLTSEKRHTEQVPFFIWNLGE